MQRHGFPVWHRAQCLVEARHCGVQPHFKGWNLAVSFSDRQEYSRLWFVIRLCFVVRMCFVIRMPVAMVDALLCIPRACCVMHARGQIKLEITNSFQTW